MNKKKVSIIIVNYNGKKHLEKCLPSVFNQNYKNIEVVLVDNGSSDGSTELVKKNFQKVKLIINNSNLGFAEANNQGYRISTGDYILFLNNDTVVTKSFLSELVKGLKDKSVGGLQSKILLLDKKDTLDVAGSFLTRTGFLYHLGHKHKDVKKLDKVFDIYSAKGACMIFPKEVLEKVKVNDEVFDSEFFAYFEESDLCHRVWLAGYKIKYYPDSLIYHKMGATSTKMKSSLIQYHSFKNRINTYIKNLEIGSLLVILPLHLLLAYISSFAYLFQFNLSLFYSINKAIWWNITHLDQTIRKRKIVQTKIRKKSDKKIKKLIVRNPEINYYRYLFTGLENYKYQELN